MHVRAQGALAATTLRVVPGCAVASVATLGCVVRRRWRRRNEAMSIAAATGGAVAALLDPRLKALIPSGSGGA